MRRGKKRQGRRTKNITKRNVERLYRGGKEILKTKLEKVPIQNIHG